MASPRVLRVIWEGWKRVAHAIGVVQTKIVLTLFYFLLLGPAALSLRLARRDLLHPRSADNPGYWAAVEQEEIDLERCKRQF